MAAHRNRLRVRVRSFVTGLVLRYVSEREARIMIAENDDGSDMLGEDGKFLEAMALRLSRKKAALTDIRLLEPERNKKGDACTITRRDVENNAFVRAGFALGDASYAMRDMDRSIDKVAAWPEEYDEQNVGISAGKVHGAQIYCPWPPDRVLSFA